MDMNIEQERNNAILTLEKLQYQYQAYFGIEPEPELINDDILKSIYQAKQKSLQNVSFEQFREAQIKGMIEARKNCPSRFENLNWYGLLTNLIKKIEKIIEKEGYSIDNYLFGSLYSGRLNGIACPVENSRYKLILIENGLFGFANLICKVLANCFPLKVDINSKQIYISQELDQCFKEIDSIQDIRLRLWDLICAYLIGGEPNLAKQYIIQNDHFFLYEGLLNSFEFFVLGHEFGHIIAGHLNNESYNLLPITENEIKEISKNWRDELEADLIGLRLSFFTMQSEGYDNQQSLCGSELFFSSVELIENSIDILKYGQIKPLNRMLTTHPPIAIRRKSILDELMNSTQGAVLIPYLKLSKMIEKIIEKLWEYIEPSLQLLHERNVKLAKIWQ
jgi:hypothetical protein